MSKFKTLAVLLPSITLGAFVLCYSCLPASAGTTALVSLGDTGVQGDRDSVGPAVSGDGNYVAFTSSATNLIFGDSPVIPWERHVFLRDRIAATTILITYDYVTGGYVYNGNSDVCDITPDGRYVVYFSDNDSLVPNDTNIATDIFLWDRLTGLNEIVSVSSTGEPSNYTSVGCSASADGRFIAFASAASNLVPGDTNEVFDIFVRDRSGGTTVRASVSSEGGQAESTCSGFPSISGDGRYVAFNCEDANLVPDDTNLMLDVFIHDTLTGITELASLGSGGEPTNGDSHVSPNALSADGGTLSYSSIASNIVRKDKNDFHDIFVYDRARGTTERVNVSASGKEANNNSFSGQLSDDGRFVAYRCLASNLLPDDTNELDDVYIFDRDTGITKLVSVSTEGIQTNFNSGNHYLAPTGGHVSFMSWANNLVPDDVNLSSDVFIRTLDSPSSCTPSPEVCDDGIDNDCDGKEDCADKKDCNKDPACK